MKNQSVPTLFVAFSHALTQSQKEGWDNIITLADVAPELQKQMSAIPATASLSDIQEIAKAIVAEAVKVGATHFYCVGEPTLTMYANLYAYYCPSGEIGYEAEIFMQAQGHGRDTKSMTCIQSTTERRSVDVTNPDGTVTKTAVFQHVQWRPMF